MLSAVEYSNIDPPQSVTIVDDDPDDREDLMDQLSDENIEPKVITGQYGSRIEALIEDVLALDTPFVICDHRLQTKNLASFNGASLIKALKSRNKPAMLLTMYQSTNRLELREARADLPVVVSRHDFDISRLGIYSEVCRREFTGEPVDERRPHRTLISVKDIKHSHGEALHYVTIPSWRPDEAIILPVGCIDRGLLGRFSAGDYLLADVNIGAREEDDLYFRNVDEFLLANQIVDS